MDREYEKPALDCLCSPLIAMRIPAARTSYTVRG